MRITSAVAGVAALALIGAGLTGSARYQPNAPTLRGQVRQIEVGDPVSPRALGAADTRFGLALLAELGGGNVVFSPSSVTTALGMAYLGARGDTATAMANAMCLPSTGTPLVAGLADRTARLGGLSSVDVSDTVWLDPTVPTRQDYLDRVATAYHNGVRQVPLLTDPGASADAINEAVRRDTHDAIPEIVSPDQLDSIGWVLTDAIYLNARWADPFAATDTEPGTFHTPDGAVSADYLNQTSTVDVARSGGWTAVSLPYRGHRLEMVALMSGDPTAVPSGGELDRLLATMAPQTTSLSLPKVDLTFRRDLSGPLGALGMGVAFSGRADFTSLSPDAARLAFVLHRATMRVAERGTEAAAVTAGGAEITSAPVPQNPIRFDHPYLMLIRDTATGEPLFLARVTNP